VNGAPALASLRRIWGLMYRHIILYRRSWPRLVELAYWPALQMFIWGFTATFFLGRLGNAGVLAFGLLVALYFPCSRYRVPALPALTRLGDEGARALAQAPYAIAFHGLGGDNHHRYVHGLRMPGQHAGGLEAVEAGHDDIHEDEVRTLAMDPLDAFLGRPGGHDPMPGLFEHAGEHAHVHR
jgi:hypothetical protein